jgi:hypothetical protein
MKKMRLIHFPNWIIKQNQTKIIPRNRCGTRAAKEANQERQQTAWALGIAKQIKVEESSRWKKEEIRKNQ